MLYLFSNDQFLREQSCSYNLYTLSARTYSFNSNLASDKIFSYIIVYSYICIEFPRVHDNINNNYILVIIASNTYIQKYNLIL